MDTERAWVDSRLAMGPSRSLSSPSGSRGSVGSAFPLTPRTPDAPSAIMSAKFWSRSSASSMPTPVTSSPASSTPTAGEAPSLALSAATRSNLERLADSALQDAMRRYHTYRELQQRHVPGDQWRQVKRLANLVAYRERPAWRKRDEQRQQLMRSLAGPPAAVKGAVDKQQREVWDAPNVLVVGALQGALDDEMYGAFVGSDKAARLRSSYVDDGLQDFQWLATLQTPTLEDPFRSCGVARAVVGSGVGRCELCCVVSMGFTRSERGERVGYYVLQSVNLNCATGAIEAAGAADSTGAQSSWLPRRRLVRASTSMCWLKCELREPMPRLELFAHGSLAPRGSSFGVAGMALRAAFSLAMTSDVAYAKKLRWMMHDALGRGRRLSAPQEDCMGQCKPAFGTGSKSLGCCVVCRETVCRSCRIDRRITVDVSAGGAQQMRCGICVLCMTRAQQSSAAPFVARESAPPAARPAPARRSPPSPASKSTSTPPLPAARRRRATATSAPVRTPPSRLTVPSIAVL